jgi:hypothetical protein
MAFTALGHVEGSVDPDEAHIMAIQQPIVLGLLVSQEHNIDDEVEAMPGQLSIPCIILAP